VHPQVQLSAFRRCRAAFFCAGVNPARFTPGNSVGVHRILQEYLACVRESLYASLDRKAEERTDFEDVGVDRMQASMLPHDAPLRIDTKVVGKAGTPPYAEITSGVAMTIG